MREIIFKAKRKYNGEWIEGDLLHPDKELGGGYYIEEIDKSKKNNCHEVIEETICQYTGLKDKNGKKIWEGDIVKGTDALQKGLKVYGHIEHKDGSFVIVGEFFTHYRWLDYEVEVIGNIFDNPELMGV